MQPSDRTIAAGCDIFSITFTADGKSIAGYCRDHKIHFFDLATGRKTSEAAWHGQNRRGLAFAHRKYFLAAGSDRIVHVYSLADGKELHKLSGHSGSTGRLAISPDGKILASSSTDERAVRLWDLATNRQKYVLPDGIGGASEMAFSPDGSRLVVGNFDTDVRVFDTRTGELLRKVESIPVSMFAMTFSPDGKQFASAGVDRTIYLWNTRTWELERKLTGSPHMISSLSFSPDGGLLLAGGFDETTLRNPVKIQFWNVARGTIIHTVDSPHRVNAAVFSPDGQWAATADGDKEIRLWKVPTTAH